MTSTETTENRRKHCHTPADKGRVTVVMDKTDYYDKMDALVNNKQTYQVLKRDPTPALQRKLNGKLLDQEN